jgi:hypothetical protein
VRTTKSCDESRIAGRIADTTQALSQSNASGKAGKNVGMFRLALIRKQGRESCRLVEVAKNTGLRLFLSPVRFVDPRL